MANETGILSIAPSAVLVQLYKVPFRIPGVPVKPPNPLKEDNSKPGVRVLNKVSKRVTIRRVLVSFKDMGLEFREAYYNPGCSVCTLVMAAEHAFGSRPIPEFLRSIVHGTFHQCISVWANPRQDATGNMNRIDCILLANPTKSRRPQREILMEDYDYHVRTVFS